MRFYLCIFLLSITLAQAQTYEAGVILGGTNALADVGSQKHLSPSNLVLVCCSNGIKASDTPGGLV